MITIVEEGRNCFFEKLQQFLGLDPSRRCASARRAFCKRVQLEPKDAVAKNMTLEQRIDQLPELPVETCEVLSELGHADNVSIVTIRPEQASQAG